MGTKLSKYSVSAIMTVKNGGKYLRLAVESINQQSLPVDEIIIVDDGSSDDTVEILTQLGTSNKQLKLILTKGVGRARALNIAWKSATSDWIANLDADDMWAPDKIEMQLRFYDANPEFSLIATSSVNFGPEQTTILRSANEFSSSQLFYEVTPKKLCTSNPINHSSVLIKREALLALKGYDECLRSQLDYDLWVRCAESAARIALLASPLSGKRVHPDQSFEQNKRVRYLISAAKINIIAIKRLGFRQHYHFYFLTAVRLLFGFLPSNVRRIISRFFKIS